MKASCTYPRGHNGACSDGKRRYGRCGLAPAKKRQRAEVTTVAPDRAAAMRASEAVDEAEGVS